MSALIEDLQALLNPLAANGAFYGVNTTQTLKFPYIVFQRIASQANVSLRGPSDIQGTRVQVDIWSLHMAEAVAIETAVEAAFNNWAVQNVPELSQDMYDDAVRAFRVSKDYTVWATN